MKAGMLRTQVALQSPTTVEDSVYGDRATTSYTTAATVWADARPTNGDEVARDGLQTGESVWKIRIRFRTDVKTGWRVTFDGLTVNLFRVEDPTRRRQELHLYGTAVHDPEAA